MGLTPAGQIYYRLFTRQLSEFNRLQQEITGRQTSPAPEVRFGLMYEFLSGGMETGFLQYAGIHPSVPILCARNEPHALLSALERGTLDAVVTFGLTLENHPHREKFSSILLQHVYVTAYVLASLQFDPSFCQKNKPCELPCYIWQEVGLDADGIEARFRRDMAQMGLQFSEVEVVPNPESLRLAVELGRGISVQTDSCSLDRNSKLKQHRLSEEGVPVVLAWRANEDRPFIRDFISFVSKAMQLEV